MPWHYQRSMERVQKHLANLDDIEVEPLDREMDLENLSEKKCRQIYGSHVYVEVRNLSTLVNEMDDDDGRRRVIQATHCYQREVARIADAVGAVRVQFQSARAHLLVYRPIRNATDIAAKAVVAQLVCDRFSDVFSETFATLPDLHVRSGSDLGDAIGTRNGVQGDRELLFLGAPANHAAKLLATGSDRRVSETMRRSLPEDLAAFVENDPEGGLRLRRPTDAEFTELLQKHAISWSVDESRERLDADRRAFPASKAAISGAEVKIDFDTLSYTNNKFVEGAALYGDVSGFTAYIDGATTIVAQKEALKSFHAVRKEMAKVLVDDFDGIRVQYQGDRVQGFFHMPPDDDARFSEDAVRAAVGLQSSFELILKVLRPDLATTGIAVGVSEGNTIAAKLGEFGHRDRICLGTDVLRAERNEERVDRREIGISQNVRDNLPAELRTFFTWRDSAGCYVATGLDQNVLDLAEGARDLNRGKPVFVRSTGAGLGISTRPGTGTRRDPSPSHGV
jgi:hypothetical protein